MRLKFIDSTALVIKLAVVPVILIGSMATVVSSIAAGIEQQRSDAVLINAAGRQRMLNQRFVKELMLAAKQRDQTQPHLSPHKQT
jgi:nitrate/nitrite-specific signal transduction histidine kinase